MREIFAKTSTLKDAHVRWYQAITGDISLVNYRQFKGTPLGMVGEFAWTLRFAFTSTPHKQKYPDYDTFSDRKKVLIGLEYIGEAAKSFREYIEAEFPESDLEVDSHV